MRRLTLDSVHVRQEDLPLSGRLRLARPASSRSARLGLLLCGRLNRTRRASHAVGGHCNNHGLTQSFAKSTA